MTVRERLQQRAAAHGYGKEEVTAHGFRVTASTILNSRGYDPDVIEAALAHQDTNAIRQACNRSTYWK